MLFNQVIKDQTLPIPYLAKLTLLVISPLTVAERLQ